MRGSITVIGILFLSFFFFASQAQNQNDKRDAGLWTTASFAPRPIAGKWKTLYTLEYRSKGNFGETDLFSGMVKCHYKMNRYLLIGVGYEFFLNRGNNGRYTPEHRYYPEGILSYRIKRFSASFRSRLTNTFTQWRHPFFEHRNRVKVSYSPIRKVPVNPFVYAEPFHEMTKYRFRKIRYAAGCAYTFNRHQWDIYYMREDYHTRPFTRHVIGIDYTYSL